MTILEFVGMCWVSSTGRRFDDSELDMGASSMGVRRHSLVLGKPDEALSLELDKGRILEQHQGLPHELSDYPICRIGTRVLPWSINSVRIGSLKVLGVKCARVSYCMRCFLVLAEFPLW